MSYIDAGILNVTEWWCHRFQALTGRTNVWLAVQLTNLSIVVYFVWAGVYFLRLDWGWRMMLAAFCAAVLYGLTQTVFKEPIELYEANAYRRVAKGLRNPRRLRDWQLRISFVTLSMLMAFEVYFLYLTPRPVPLFISLSFSLAVLMTVLLYVLACDPLPPCTGKVWAFLGALRRADRRPLSTGTSRDDSCPSFAGPSAPRPRAWRRFPQTRSRRRISDRRSPRVPDRASPARRALR
jgi:hypothetical protein